MMLLEAGYGHLPFNFFFPYYPAGYNWNSLACKNVTQKLHMQFQCWCCKAKAIKFILGCLQSLILLLDIYSRKHSLVKLSNGMQFPFLHKIKSSETGSHSRLILICVLCLSVIKCRCLGSSVRAIKNRYTNKPLHLYRCF